MTGTELRMLVEKGDLQAALAHAEHLTPKRVWDLLIGDLPEPPDDAQPYADFVQAWYHVQESPYIRAEIAANFDQTYLTELCIAADAEHIGARMATSSKREVLQHVADQIDDDAMEVWTYSPEQPLSKESLSRWREIAGTLRNLDYPDEIALP